MSEVSTELQTSVELAKERSHEAADRTLMAWIRTSLTLISFGFGIGKLVQHFMDVEMTGRGFNSPLVFGLAFVALGTLSLLAAVIQNWHVQRLIKRREFICSPPWPLTEVVAVVLVLIGLLAFVGMLP